MQDHLYGEVKLPKECVFFVHGNGQHMGGGCTVNRFLSYHQYWVPEVVNLNGVIAIVYSDSMRSERRNKHVVLLGDVDPLYTCGEEEGADDNVPRSTVPVRMIKKRDGNSPTDV